MKWILLILVLGSQMAVAANRTGGEPYSFGLSNQVVPENQGVVDDSMTAWLLHQQAISVPPKHSELSAALYVDSQKRLADSFKSAIPDSFDENTTDDSN